MIKLLDINNLKQSDILQIWGNVSREPIKKCEANIAWSFEGNGIRTRTTFIQAFQRLGLSFVELPNFLKTGESVQDLAGYMDAFYDMYIIRDSNHKRMVEFAGATRRPMINAMSSEAHPCEVLTDAYYLHSKFGDLASLRILLWGPLTNVFTSWYSLSEALNFNLTHFCPKEYHCERSSVSYAENLVGQYDVVITDAWPSGFFDEKYSLSQENLLKIGEPELLPTPPVNLGKELLFVPSDYRKFSGYNQKNLLLPVQESIIAFMLG